MRLALVKEAKLPAVINRAFKRRMEGRPQSELTGKLDVCGTPEMVEAVGEA